MKKILVLLLLFSIKSFAQGLEINGWFPIIAEAHHQVSYLGGHTTDLQKINKEINTITSNPEYLIGWEIFVQATGLKKIPGFKEVIGFKADSVIANAKFNKYNFDIQPTKIVAYNLLHYKVGINSNNKLDLGAPGVPVPGKWSLQSLLPVDPQHPEILLPPLFYDSSLEMWSRAYYGDADLTVEGEVKEERNQTEHPLKRAKLLFSRLGPGSTPLNQEVEVEDGRYSADDLAPGYYKIEVLQPKRCQGVVKDDFLIAESTTEDFELKCTNPYAVTLEFELNSEVHAITGTISWDDYFIEYARGTREDSDDSDWPEEYNPISEFTTEDATAMGEIDEEGELINTNGDQITIPFRNLADIVTIEEDDFDSARGLINLSFERKTSTTPSIGGTMLNELECKFDSMDGSDGDYYFVKRNKGWLDDILDDDDSDDDLTQGDDQSEETTLPTLEIQATDDYIDTFFLKLKPYKVFFNWSVNIICRHPDPEQYGEMWITLGSELFDFDKEGQTFESFSAELLHEDGQEFLTRIKENQDFSFEYVREFDYGMENPVELRVQVEGLRKEIID